MILISADAPFVRKLAPQVTESIKHVHAFRVAQKSSLFILAEIHQHQTSTRTQFARALFGEQRAVGGQADVVDAVDRGQPRDEHVDIAAQQWFAAGQAQFAHAQARGDARQALDLVEVQQFAARQEQVFAAEQLPRHAVGAAEVAAVR